MKAEPLPRETRGFQPRQIQPSADVPNGNTASAAPSGARGHHIQAAKTTASKTEPHPRETLDIKPRQAQSAVDVPTENTTSATPFGTRSHDAQAATPTAIKTEPPPRETQGTWPRQDQSISDAQHGNMTSASPSGIRSHDTQVDEPTNEDKGASRTLLTNTVIHPDRAPGLSDSQWAPKATLTSLAGLRPHPEPVKAWDDSNGFKLSTRLGIDFNELPRHAWNGGVDPMSTRKATSSVGRATPQPVNPVRVLLLSLQLNDHRERKTDIPTTGCTSCK